MTPARDMFAAPFERDQQALHARAPAHRRYRIAELRQQRVVTPAAAERKADLRQVALEDETGIVIEVPQQREIDRDAVAVAKRRGANKQRFELVECRLALRRFADLARCGDAVAAAAPQGEIDQKRLVELAQTDDVALFHQRLRRRDRIARQTYAGQDAIDDSISSQASIAMKSVSASASMPGEPISSTPACVNSRIRPSCGWS